MSFNSSDNSDGGIHNTKKQFTDAFSRDMIGTDVIIRVPRPEHAKMTTSSHLEFKCHKFILAARCEFFKAMFSHEAKEAITNTTELPDCRVKTLKTLLKYFYTDVVSEDEVDLDLLKVADMYLLKELKDYCSSILSSQIPVKDAVNIFVFARSVSSWQIASAALDVISANFNEIKRTQGWKENQANDFYYLMADTLASRQTDSKTVTTSEGLVLIDQPVAEREEEFRSF